MRTSPLPVSSAASTSATSSHPRLSALVAEATRLALTAPPEVAVVAPRDERALEAVEQIAATGLARPLLVGLRQDAEAAARHLELDLDAYDWVEAPDGAPAAAAIAVALARSGRVQALMKGSLHTDELMSAVVDRERGLRTARRISHAFVFDLPRYHKLLALSDCVVNIAPDLKTKGDIVANAVDLLRCLGIDAPKVGVVAAVETVNPAIPATLDARALIEQARGGAWPGALVDGPFGFDNAFSVEAARAKKIDSAVAGDADLLLMPDLNAGNMLYKGFTYVGGGECGGLVLGARVPIVLTSRADSLTARLASLALAVLAQHHVTAGRSS